MAAGAAPAAARGTCGRSAATNGRAGWSGGCGPGAGRPRPFGSAGLGRSQVRVRWSRACGRRWGRGAARKGERRPAGGGGPRLREQVPAAEVARPPRWGEREGGGSGPSRPHAAVSTCARRTCRRAAPAPASRLSPPRQPGPYLRPPSGEEGPPSSAEPHEQ